MLSEASEGEVSGICCICICFILICFWQPDRSDSADVPAFHYPFIPLKITQKPAQLFAADPRTWLKHPRLASSQHKNHDTDDTSVL